MLKVKYKKSSTAETECAIEITAAFYLGTLTILTVFLPDQDVKGSVSCSNTAEVCRRSEGGLCVEPVNKAALTSVQ